MENLIYDVNRLPLGDEMSMSRNLVIDLLIQNLITNDTIIYTKKTGHFCILKFLRL